jgi:hypothetical protein
MIRKMMCKKYQIVATDRSKTAKYFYLSDLRIMFVQPNTRFMVNLKLVAYEETPEFTKLGLTRFDEGQLQKLMTEDYTHFVLENITHTDGQHLYFQLIFYKTEANALLYYGLINKNDGDSLAGSLGDEIIRHIAAETEIKAFYKARTKQRALARFIDRLA